MKSLIIYDDEGNILIQKSGTYTIPQSVQLLEIEIPEGEMLKGMDTTVEPHVPVFISAPKTDAERLTEQERELADLQYTLMMGGVI